MPSKGKSNVTCMIERFTPDELLDMAEYDRRVEIECNRHRKKSSPVLEHGEATEK